MNVTRLQLSNFRSYGNLDLKLPDGATALIGPNGAGKSSILTAIEVGLFGAPSLEPYLRRGAERLELTVYVEHGGERYRVRRGWKGKSSTDFERRSGVDDVAGAYNERFAPLTLETQAKTQSLIESTLGLTRETFRASAYLAQGDSDAITAATPAERMKILRATIGGLELFELAHKRATNLHRNGAVAVDRYAGSIEVLEHAAAERPACERERADLAGRIAEGEEWLETAARKATLTAEALEVGRSAVAEARSLETEEQLAAERLARLDFQAEDARGAAQALEAAGRREQELRLEAEPEQQLAAEVEELAAQVLRHEHEQAAYAAALDEQDTLLAEVVDRRRRADELLAGALADAEAGPGESRCRECQQVLGAEALMESIAARKRLAAGHLGDADEFERRAVALNVGNPPAAPPLVQLHAAREAHAEARHAGNQLALVRGRLGMLQAAAARVDTDEFRSAYEQALAAQLAAARAAETARAGVAALDLETLEDNATRSADNEMAARRQLDHLGRAMAVAEHKLDALAEQEARLANTRESLQIAEREQAVLAVVAEMFAPAGIPLLVIEGAVPLIEQRAQEVLERLGGETASCRVELRTQRATKTTGELRDTLDILIHTAGGDAVPYEQWSGGERMRLDLAIRVGLAQLLLVHGAQVELFAVDEPDGLDAQGRAALVEVIEDMADRFGFRKVLLISHDDALRDALPQALEVARSPSGGSQVVAA